MKIRQKTMAGFLVISLFIPLLSYIGFHSQQSLVENFHHVASEMLPDTVTRVKMEVELYRTIHAAVRYGASGALSDKQEVEKSLASLADYRAIHDLYHSKMMQGLDHGSARLLGQFSGQIIQYILLREKNSSPLLLAEAKGQIDATVAQFSKMIDSDKDIRTASQAVASALEQQSRTLNIMIHVSILIFIMVLVVSLILSRLLVRPIHQLKEALTAIGQGEGSKEIRVDSQDEIQDLAQTFNDLLARLRSTQEQLIQSGKLAAIGELAAGMAHELNQPLMVLRSKNQLLQRRQAKQTLTPEHICEAMDSTERNTKRMMNIISHLRTFAHQSDKVLVPVDLNKVVADSFYMIGEQLNVCNIMVSTDLAQGLPKILGDASRLEQVILNLLTNSRDAVVERRERGEEMAGAIQIRTWAAGERVTLEIQDNGAGIPADKKDKIFEPFVTTKEVGKGTGLGLSISYGIIQDHGGDIRVATTGPEGTVFRVELPLVAPPAAEAAETAHPGPCFDS